jgi:hypothetical protein
LTAAPEKADEEGNPWLTLVEIEISTELTTIVESVFALIAEDR